MTRILPVMILAVVVAVARADAAPQQRPNFLIIMTDDQARWSLGAYGNTDSVTPNMDRLARDGALFTNAFVNTPVCSPSRATFFTGRHGTQLAITDWINPAEARAGVGLSADVVTWPAVLQKNGYRTGLIGKWHLGERPPMHPTKRGFDYFMGFLNGGEVAMNANLEVEGKVRNVKGPIPDRLADDAIRFLERNAKGPFALCLFFREPHLPYRPVPPEDSAPFEDADPKIPDVPFINPAATKEIYRRYYASIHAADRNIGRVLAKLDELKLADNTVVLFTSDHGYNIGHHGVYTKGNARWFAANVEGPKRPNMYEESIRVPLLVRWPRVVKSGTRVDAMVGNVDTFATILAIAGVPIPSEVEHEGRDLSPLLRDEPVPTDWRDAVFGQYDLHNGGLAFMRMARSSRWKLVRHHFANGLDELYDLENDPAEAKNLYHVPEARAARDELQAKLTAWQKSIDDPILKADRYPTQPPGGDGR